MEAHPDNVEIAETAARVVGLDIAGIDFICPDIEERSARRRRHRRVNAAPGFRMHTHPTEGEPQYVARPVSTCCSRPARRPASRSRRHGHQRQDTTVGCWPTSSSSWAGGWA